jgi:hypothetical protein
MELTPVQWKPSLTSAKPGSSPLRNPGPSSITFSDGAGESDHREEHSASRR